MALTTQTKSQLTTLFDKRQLALDPVELIAYEMDASFETATPDGVFYPESTEDVSRIMTWANETGTPLVARAGGTGLAGGALAEQGGIVISSSRMNSIDIDPQAQTVIAQAGAVNQVVDGMVKAHGLYYPPDPASGRASCIGGNLGTNAGGPHCFKYGVTTNYITGLQVVLADGEVVQLGGLALDYPEYDLCGLIVGSEGTLAVATEAYLRLVGNPPAVRTMMVAFDSEQQAGIAVSEVIKSGLVPATLEMMDQRAMQMIEEATGVELPSHAGAALIVEMDGYPESVGSQIEEIADVLSANGGMDLRIAQSEAERQQIWYGRKSAAGALARIAPSYYLTDVTVPRSYLGEMLKRVNDLCDANGIRTMSVFHAGDGNLHPLMLCDSNDPELMERIHHTGKEVIELCLEYDGSITGEHGVGMEKRDYMPMMYTDNELHTMLQIKDVFDPQNLLNPGKIFPQMSLTPTYAEPAMPSEQTFAPHNADEAASAFAAFSDANKTASTVNGHADFYISTANLQGIHKFAPDDLYVTVGAGTPLQEVNDFLAEHGMQTLLASPRVDTTVGELLDQNINSPQRIRYGSVRDSLLCATVALPDGRTIRAGRPVVKNVAGYDLPKVFVGAHGTLGLLTEATLKLVPLPRAKKTIGVAVDDLSRGILWARESLKQPLVASGVVIAQAENQASFTLQYTTEGLPEDVDAELDIVRNVWQRENAPTAHITPSSATEAWQQFMSIGYTDDVLVRAGLPTKHLDTYVTAIPAEYRTSENLMVDYGNGFVYARHSGDGDVGSDVNAWLAALRKPAVAAGGYAIVMAGSDAVDGDAWGYQPQGLSLMRQLKATWDPAGVLNSGMFVV
ncbi:MAG: FAD-linked oxidase C-terminal domain-containing protein [Chloroflexota bacterium]